MSSLVGSPTNALYHAVHQIYVPTMLNSGKSGHQLDPKLQKLLSELDASLGSVMRKSSGKGKVSLNDEDNFGGILPL